MNREITAEEYDAVLAVGAGVAAEVRRAFHPFVDHVDLMGEVAEWACSNPSKVSDYYALDEREFRAVVAVALRHRLRRYAMKQKAASLGHSYRDLVFYSADQLKKELLPCLFDPEDWASPPKAEADALRQKTDPAHGGNWMASLADVADAYRRLGPDDRRLIEMKWRGEMKLSEMADALEVSDTVVSDRIVRAVDRMVWLLGGERPTFSEDEIPVGRRRVISNAAAHARTGSDYEGG